MSGLTNEEASVLRMLYRKGGSARIEGDSFTIGVLLGLAGRGLVWQTPGGMWWLTVDGQELVRDLAAES